MVFFIFCLTLSLPEKLENSIFEIPIISQNLNINNQRTTSAKSINLQIIRKLIEYFFKNAYVKAFFTLTVLKIFLLEGRLVLPPAQRDTGNEKVTFSMENPKKCFAFVEMASKVVDLFFLFCLTLSVPEKLKNSIFEIPIIPHTLNINNQRTTSTRSINLHIITKAYRILSKKCFCEGNVYFTVFEILLFEGRSVLVRAQRGTGSESVNIYTALNLSTSFHSQKPKDKVFS